MTKPIPISAAEKISKEYDYDQIIIIGRKIDSFDESMDGCEHVTTYGKDKENCDVAALIGNFLKYKIMGWTE